MRYLMAVPLLLLANGCFFFPGGSWTDDDWDYYEDEVFVVDGRIEDAALYGQMVDLGEFDGDVYEAEYIGGYGSATITLHAGHEGGSDFGWAMIGLTTYAEGGFEGATFAPGNTLTIESGQLDAQGCTGQTHGDWDFDGHASQVEVRVEEGPDANSRLFHVRAVYDQVDGGVTEGTFVLRLPEGHSEQGTLRN